MKVSIITVSYNSEKFIQECIDSVKNQTYNNIEYIIIDGNSKDLTKDILHRNKERIDILISEEDNGIYDAINKGIMKSSGDIIGLLNSDDKFHDINVVSRIVNSLTSDFDCVYADSYFINPISNKKTRYYSSNHFSNWKFKIGLMPSHPSIYFKSDIIKNKPLYDVNFKIASDFDFVLRHFMVYKIKTRYIKDVWIIMREGGVSTMGIKSKFTITNEILSSCKKNTIYTNRMLLTFRYIYKLLGYIKK